MTGRHVRTVVQTPEQILRQHRAAAQRRFDTLGLPRGLRSFGR